MATNKKDIISRGAASILSTRQNRQRAEDRGGIGSVTLAPVKGGPHKPAPKGAAARPEMRGRPRKGEKKGWEGIETFSTTVAFDGNISVEVDEIAFCERVSRKVAMRTLLETGYRKRDAAMKEGVSSVISGKGGVTKVTTVFDREQYDRIADFAYERRISRTLAINRLLAYGIAQYRSKGSF